MPTQYSKPLAFKRTLLATAIALTFGTPAAFAAAPSPNQLPGHGVVTSGTARVTFSSQGVETIELDGSSHAVITWGGNSGAPALNKHQPAGFNIGSKAHLYFSSGGFEASVLNIDASGNPSQIMGTLKVGLGYSFNGKLREIPVVYSTDVFVANVNGIIVGSGATIQAYRVGLIGESGDALKTSKFGLSNGPYAGIVFNGTAGGKVSVAKGAIIKGDYTVLIAGGSNVNVNLDSLQAGPGGQQYWRASRSSLTRQASSPPEAMLPLIKTPF